MALVEAKSKCKRLFVAAIDFGTTFSGYAFSAKENWRKVMANTWTGGTLISLKAPTALLLGPDRSFIAFGYAAEDAYGQLAENEEHEDYYYFHRFKMVLHNQKVGRYTKIKDETGQKEMEALIVFKHSIAYLKNELLKKLKNSYPDVQLSDIDFVLTVPAIWDDVSKQFMREAAVQAGIQRDQLTIALEPEAASIYCQNLTLEQQDMSKSSFLGVVTPGTKYMVVDLGGGTADITVHEKLADGTLEEVQPASGGPWGGKSVDDAFSDFLYDIVGQTKMDKFKIENMEDYIDLFRTFEMKKRTIDPSKLDNGNTFMTIPVGFTSLIKGGKKGFASALANSSYADTVSFENTKFKWRNKDFAKFFDGTINNILDHLDSLLKKDKLQDVKIILMVGGFSECKLIQQAIREKFKTRKIVVPEDCGLAVLKGAVYFGHVPDAISRRAARYTYGIQSWPEWNDTKHPPAKKVKIGDTYRCRDVFFKYVTKGQHLTPGYRRSQIFQALKPEEKCLECAIYISDSENPRFIDEPDCRKLGVLRIDLPNVRTGATLELEETMIFGETEIRVQARDIYTNQQQEVTFDLLREIDLENE